MKKLTECDASMLRAGSFYTNKLENSVRQIERMLECGDITIAEQKELRIAKRALNAAWNVLAKQTHL